MPTKEEILDKLKTAGITEADVYLAYPLPPTDSQLKKENDLFRIHIKKLEDQLSQATDIAKQAIEDKKIKDEVAKETLIAEIIENSDGHWTKHELTGKTLGDLALIKTCLMKNRDSTFTSIAAYEADKLAKSMPRRTTFGADIKPTTGGTV
ncbi:MAG: hypothetical protein FWC33_03585 [Candidatus Bathyarchaeota archaeon]|nr:hypothetical protein [Candidatus Termiticorpusculum sp.]